jgi:hypothetical protein
MNRDDWATTQTDTVWNKDTQQAPIKTPPSPAQQAAVFALRACSSMLAPAARIGLVRCQAPMP